MKTEYQISGMRENGGLHEMVTEVVVMLTLKSATAGSRPKNTNINSHKLVAHIVGSLSCNALHHVP